MSRLDKLRAESVDEVLEEVITARAVGTDPKELFGGPREWLEAAIPAGLFGIAYGIFKAEIGTAIRLALGAEALVIVVRLVRRETLRHAFSGLFGVAFAALIAAKTGAKNFFLPGIVINATYGLGFLASVAFGKPVVGLIMGVVQPDRPREYHEHPKVRRAYVEATLGWAAVFGLRVVIMETLRRLDLVAALAVMKIVLGYPLYLGALALTVPYIRWRTREVPVPELPEPAEPEAEAGAQDAAEQAS